MSYINKLSIILIVLFSLEIFAQVDPSSALLLRSTSDQVASPSLDSSRYTVRPPAANKVPKPIVPSKSTVVEKPVDKNISVQPVVEKSAEKSEAVSGDKKISEKMREIFLGGDEESILEYREQLHAEDSRQNVASISVAPGIFYFDSASSYWFRDYHSSGPGLSAGADIWITPFMGVNIDYFTTLSAELDVDPTSSKSVLVDHRNSAIGVQFRRYSNLSRRSPNFNVAINYADYQLIIPKEETNRNRISSAGVALSFLATIPKNTTSAWTFGTTLYPKLKVKEQKTAVEIKSGTDYSAYAIKFQFGQEFTLDRKNQIFWRLSHRMDKMIYSGEASPADPISSVAPEGVIVTTGASLFELGYTWGD